MSVVQNLISKFAGLAGTQDSSTTENEETSRTGNTENTPNTEAGATQAPATEESTTHADSKSGGTSAEPHAPTSADSAPNQSTTGTNNGAAKNDSKGEAKNEEASKDGTPAHLVPDSEHYQASPNVEHILTEAEKATEAEKSKDAPADAAGEAKNQEAAPQKADQGKGLAEKDKTAAPAPVNPDGPAETVSESGYKPSEHVEHILDVAAKAEEEHKPDDHATDQDKEAKKIDNPTAGATNASHPQSEPSAVGNSDQPKIAERKDDEPGQVTTESGYKPSDHVKQMLALADKTVDSRKSVDHTAGTDDHKNLDEPTAQMSVHEESRNEN